MEGNLERRQALNPLSIVNICKSLAACGGLRGNGDDDGSQLCLRNKAKMQ